jgi:hypothetical protein
MRRSASGMFATSVYCEVDGLPAVLDTAGLSSAGAFVLTPTPAAIDRELELFLRSEAGEITLQGQVVQVIDVERAAREARAPGFGVLFTNLGDTQRVWLDKTRVALARAARERIETARTVASMPGVSPAPPAAPRPRTVTPPATPSMAPSAPRTANPLISPEAQNLVRRMREELDELSKAPPWRVLDVESTCSAAQAKTAFFSASKQFHPHLFARHNCPELDQLVTELFILHKRAFTSLSQAANARAPKTPSATRRAAPVITTSSPPPASEPEPSGIQQRVAKLHTTPRSERPAAKSPSDRPGSPEAGVRARAQIMVNDALKTLAGGRLAEAHAQLQQAFETDPTYSQAELWLLICQARVAKADDRQLLSVDFYAKVLKLDPQNREALAAIRAAGPAGESTTKKLFGKLFGAGKD